jgi:RNA polymerase sigma factor (sigma-70 family)
MDSRTDTELLREYAQGGAEAAFSELVRRYIDLVYSAALRLIGNSHLAEEVSQKVFLALAHNTERLSKRDTVCGWLHRTTHNLSVNVVRSEVRRRTREQEAAVMNQLLSAEPQAAWESVAPELDAALNQLSEPDRDAVLLRYFQHKSAREIAQILGISGEAAQKRVNRAIERLRSFFANRGIAVGSGGLVVLISANAVQAAPVGLAATVSAAALSGTAIHTSTAIATTKLLVMTTLNKIIIASAVVAALGTGIYHCNQARVLRERLQTLTPQPTATARSEPSQPEPAAPVSATSVRPANSRPAAAPRRVARSHNAPGSGGFTSTELYAFITNTPYRLTLAQVAPYLNANGRSGSNLLAAFRITGEPALLAEAMEKFPNEPLVGFEAATRNDASPEERRAGLEAFKKAAPDNALAYYLSALDYFKAGNKVAAVQELTAAVDKPQFQDYTPERIQNNEAVYLAAGFPPGQAKMMGNWFLPEAQLVQVRELGQNLVDLSGTYREAGDQESSAAALQMALDLGKRFDDPSAGQSMRWQLIGIRVERAALGAMDAAGPIPGTDQLVQDRLNQLAGQMQSIQALSKQADPIWKTLSDQDWTDYHSQIAALGEEGALRWLVNNYGQQ